MKASYDATIAEHYASVAAQEGLSPLSTMADELTRAHETDAIVAFIASESARIRRRPLRVADVGCGNGYTLSVVAERFPDIQLTGIEQSQELRELAASRFPSGSVRIRAGDIRDAGFAGEKFDVIICQRVLINLLDANDQRQALDNIVDSVVPNGGLLFIEAFSRPLENLNTARAEFGLPPICPAHHNLYLPDGFFEHSHLLQYSSANWLIPSNFLSTHYFVTRVLHPVLLGSRPFKRNSEFVRFFSSALPPAVGEYSPLMLHCFIRQ